MKYFFQENTHPLKKVIKCSSFFRVKLISYQSIRVKGMYNSKTCPVRSSNAGLFVNNDINDCHERGKKSIAVMMWLAFTLSLPQYGLM